MFSWILKKINKSLLSKQHLLYVGVLDIFGFEDFAKNRFAKQMKENFDFNQNSKNIHESE